MKSDEIKKAQDGEVPEAAPEITQEMIQTTFKALEAEGLIFYTKSGAYLPTEEGWKLLRELPSGKEEITAHGHKGITARDENCFEISKNKDPRGDSTVAVRANKVCKDLSNDFKLAVKNATKVFITIEADGSVEKVTAYGSPALKLTDGNEIVVRKSDAIDGKTVAILADKSANNFSKSMKEKLKDPKTEIKITFEIK